MLAKGIELAVLCVFMAAASYGAGLLLFRLDKVQSHLNIVSQFSVGILVSTCLVIAIPEGVEILYDAAHVNYYELLLLLAVGMLLISGYFFMFVVDNSQTLMALFDRRPLYSMEFDESDISSVPRLLLSVFKSTVSLGLVIHAAVDGVSLGSAFNEDSNSLQLFFFFAIIVHKLPTAFSLPTILLNDDVPAKIAKTHLFLFSLMTPFTSLLTYVLLLSVSGKRDYIVSSLVIFSGGLFLYVVSLLTSKSQSHAPIDEQTGSKERAMNLVYTALGMAVPVIIAPFKY